MDYIVNIIIAAFSRKLSVFLLLCLLISDKLHCLFYITWQKVLPISHLRQTKCQFYISDKRIANFTYQTEEIGIFTSQTKHFANFISQSKRIVNFTSQAKCIANFKSQTKCIASIRRQAKSI